MSESRQDSTEIRAGVSISEMARAVGLSRQRFYQLVRDGVFPAPLKDETSSRPYYDEATQQQCLEIRRRNFGINSQVVLFYARRQSQPTPKPHPTKAQPTKSDQHADILDGLKSLGLSSATAAQVAEAIKTLFPRGTDSEDAGEVIRAVFVRLRRKNSAENVGRK
jgi:hypothetical protein